MTVPRAQNNDLSAASQTLLTEVKLRLRRGLVDTLMLADVKCHAYRDLESTVYTICGKLDIGHPRLSQLTAVKK